jgi:hypothetical protein
MEQWRFVTQYLGQEVRGGSLQHCKPTVQLEDFSPRGSHVSIQRPTTFMKKEQVNPISFGTSRP